MTGSATRPGIENRAKEEAIQKNLGQADLVRERFRLAPLAAGFHYLVWLGLLVVDVALVHQFYADLSLDRFGQVNGGLVLVLQALVVLGPCLILERAVAVIPGPTRRLVYIAAGLAALALLFHLGAVREMGTADKMIDRLEGENQGQVINPAERELLGGQATPADKATATGNQRLEEAKKVIDPVERIGHLWWLALAFPLVTLGCAISFHQAGQAYRRWTLKRQAWNLVRLGWSWQGLRDDLVQVDKSLEALECNRGLLARFSQDIIVNRYEQGLAETAAELSRFRRLHATPEDQEKVNSRQVIFQRWLKWIQAEVTEEMLERARHSVRSLALIDPADPDAKNGVHAKPRLSLVSQGGRPGSSGPRIGKEAN